MLYPGYFNFLSVNYGLEKSGYNRKNLKQTKELNKLKLIQVFQSFLKSNLSQLCVCVCVCVCVCREQIIFLKLHKTVIQIVL